MARTIPDDVAEGVGRVLQVFKVMIRAARHQAKRQPAPSGIYPVTVLMDAGGDIICDDAGVPIVVIPPLAVAATGDRTVEFYHPDQRLSPRQAADLAGVHKATLQRAINAGELPKPIQISSRRVVHSLTDIQDWFAKRRA